jgi:hypothetical protein
MPSACQNSSRNTVWLPSGRAQHALEYADQGDRLQWRMATRGEAFLIKGNNDAAIEAYGKALESRPTVRELESMYKQAMWIAELRRDDEVAARINKVFRPELAASAT